MDKEYVIIINGVQIGFMSSDRPDATLVLKNFVKKSNKFPINIVDALGSRRDVMINWNNVATVEVLERRQKVEG